MILLCTLYNLHIIFLCLHFLQVEMIAKKFERHIDVIDSCWQIVFFPPVHCLVVSGIEFAVAYWSLSLP